MATRKYVSIQKLGLYNDKIKNYTDTAVNSLSTQVAYIDTEDNENIEDVGGASNITVDSALSTTSTNPVQNKVVTNKINQVQQEKADKSTTLDGYGITDGVTKEQFNEHSQDANERQSALEARMDTFTSLGNGSTSGDAELMDIRVGYDGEVYASAGTAVRTQVQNTRKELYLTNDAIDNLQNIEIGELIDGEYIGSTYGGTATNAYFARTDYIPIYPIKHIMVNMCFEGGDQSYAGLAFYDEDKYFVSSVKNDDVVGSVKIINVPQNAKYVRTCVNKKSNLTPYIKVVNLKDILSDVYTSIEENKERLESVRPISDIYRKVYEDKNLINKLIVGYVKDDGTFHTNAQWRRTNYIDVSNIAKVYFKGIIYWQYYAFYKEDKTFLGGKDKFGTWDYSNGISSIKIPPEAKYLIVSFSSVETAESGWGSITGSEPTGKTVYATTEEYRDYSYSPNNPCDYNGDEICAFNKILCIGDSITQGVFNHYANGNTEYATLEKYSYPTYLRKITGLDVVNWGIGGATSVTWLDNKKDEDFSGFDCCIINLGINDVLKGTSIDESRTAFTSILNTLKSANKNIKIFLATIVPAYAKGDAAYDNINALIKELSLNDNCYLVDMTEYGHCVKGGVYESGHLTALGYHKLAHDYKAYISHIMTTNSEEFKWIQFIGTDMTNN